MTFSAQYAIFFFPKSSSKVERSLKMIKKYSDEKRKEVIDARKAGATIAQIAAQTGVGRTTVKAWLKDADCRIIGI